jgi:hypothetical protein
MGGTIMLLIDKFTTAYDNIRFASANKTLESKRRKISKKFTGMHGIHSIGASNPEQCIKVFSHKALPMDVRQKITKLAGKFHVKFTVSKVKNPQDYHLEEAFGIDV